MYGPDNPNLESRLPTYELTQEGPHLVVKIRPEQVSAEWIPALLIHQMSHVVVKLAKKPVEKNLDEAAAYSLQKLVLNMKTKNGFDRELDQILKELSIQTEEQILNLPVAMLFSRFAVADKKMFSRPLSYAEGELRMGFYWIALGFRWVEKQPIPQKAQKNRQYKFLKTLLAKNSKIVQI